MKWYRFEKLLAGLRDERPGRPGYPALVLFKALLLQALYGLSDRELEEALGDRLSFRRFVGLGLEESGSRPHGAEPLPQRLVARGLLEKLFAELDRQLEKAGVILKRGTMLDATLIEAVSAPPHGRAGLARSGCPLRQAAGQGRLHLRLQGACRGGRGLGLIRTVITTPANVNDTVPADALIRGDEKAVWADAAYDTHARRARLKARGHEAAHRAPAQQAPSRAAAAAEALQPADRPPAGGGGDHLRHAEAPHEADRIRYVGLAKASRAGACWRRSPSTCAAGPAITP